jgi:hypothetical protein
MFSEESSNKLIYEIREIIRTSLKSVTHDYQGYPHSGNIINAVNTLTRSLTIGIPEAIQSGILKSAQINQKSEKEKIYFEVYLHNVKLGVTALEARIIAKRAADGFDPLQKDQQ